MCTLIKILDGDLTIALVPHLEQKRSPFPKPKKYVKFPDQQMHKSSAAILNLWHRARTRYLLPVTNCVHSLSCSTSALPLSAPALPLFCPAALCH